MLKLEKVRDENGNWTVTRLFCETFLESAYKRCNPNEMSAINPELTKKRFINGIKKMLKEYHKTELISHYIWESIRKEFPDV